MDSENTEKIEEKAWDTSIKLVYGPDAYRSMQKCYDYVRKGGTVCSSNLFDPEDVTSGREFSINFRVTDHVIASYLLPALLYEKSGLREDVNLGIEITSINLEPLNDETIRKRILEAIDNAFRR